MINIIIAITIILTILIITVLIRLLLCAYCFLVFLNAHIYTSLIESNF